jgi:hypothetical protein
MIKRLKRKVYQIYHKQNERWFSNQIIKRSSHSTPDFLIIGVVKGGTTSLYQYLAQHPDILIPTKKEIRYFGQYGQYNGLKWYLNHFPLKSEMHNKITFEATPSYISAGAKSAKQVADLFPKMKCILILRDPVKRAFSHWAFYQKHSKQIKEYGFLLDTRSFSEAVEEELNTPETVKGIHTYIKRGLYADQLKSWYQYFDKEKILIIDFDDLKFNPKSILKDVAIFLNIEYVYTDFSRSDKKLRGLMNKTDANGNQQLKQYNATVYLEEMNKEIELQLRNYFAKPDEELEKLTGRKFNWMR